MVHRGVGSNQYKTREAPDLPASPGPDLMAQAAGPPPPLEWPEIQSPHTRAEAITNELGEPIGARSPHTWEEMLQIGLRPEHQRLWGESPMPHPHPVSRADIQQVVVARSRPPEATFGWDEAILRTKDDRWVHTIVDDPEGGVWTTVGSSPAELVNQWEKYVKSIYTEPGEAYDLWDLTGLIVQVPELAAVAKDRWPMCGSVPLEGAACEYLVAHPDDVRLWTHHVEGSDYAELDRDDLLCALARNPHCPPDVLEHLLQTYDTAEMMAGSVAQNPSCPAPTLVRLLSHPEEAVRRMAQDNPSCPEEYRSLARVAQS